MVQPGHVAVGAVEERKVVVPVARSQESVEPLPWCRLHRLRELDAEVINQEVGGALHIAARHRHVLQKNGPYSLVVAPVHKRSGQIDLAAVWQHELHHVAGWEHEADPVRHGVLLIQVNRFHLQPSSRQTLAGLR